ncbi:tellurite resistance/C4-dicarboxylate transporter family protein [Dyadobacter alkalitolerans]|uniref:tellurite resistance/C4-dicarboxylate transporter family protein n=1 Tax=Dyadobacter alkalitolerans TaxID=492736 RepID=UPI00047C9D62|nr:tellurite resistance/C4-dicarboxylate transporter family protein [Dyadobacter alkalitolerans]
MNLRHSTKTMLPSYFAMAMATGILGVAFSLKGWDLLAKAMLFLNLTIFTSLVFALVYRIAAYEKDVIADFQSYQRGPGFLTLVAACCIIANQLILVFQLLSVAKVLLVIAAGLWLFLAYGFLFSITIKEEKLSLKDGINGGWLLLVVAIQAISVLTALVAAGSNTFLFVSLCLFLVGCVFYLYIMSLIIYRISFFILHADELGAPYWINMGATAITTLAGSILITLSDQFNLLIEIRPFLKGFTLLFWSAGTWWIPLLIILGIWKHAVKAIKTPVTAEGYDPSYWSLVFPLGMYTVSTIRLNEALHLPFLEIIISVFIFIALFAWCAVMLGFIRHLLNLLAPSKR